VEACDLRFELGKHILPEFIPPEGTTAEYLEKLCREALPKLYSPDDTAAWERLNYELSVIKQMGFPGYFLVVWDLIRLA
jgi:DNA polymerase-3 subunit alpha